VPHRWSAGAACLATGNREAVLRIPTPTEFGGAEAAGQTRLELRAADGACSPHFTLALVVLAGLEGIRDELEPPAVVAGDFDALPADERRRLGVGPMPGSLAEALDAFEADALIRAAVPDDLRVAYLAMKRLELELLDGTSDEEACARYARIY
jgi:glutamine synthetase